MAKPGFGWLGLGPGWLGMRPGRQGFRPAKGDVTYRGTYGWMNIWRYGQMYRWT